MPELVLIEIAAALAAKTAESMYELVCKKFKDRRKALEALDAAQGKREDSPEVLALAQELDMAEAYDVRFKEQLRAEWAAVRIQAPASNGSASTPSQVLSRAMSSRLATYTAISNLAPNIFNRAVRR
jgi:hypothetical protein